MRSPNHSPQPGKFRRRAAAWTAGLALVGGTAAEFAAAEPAYAGTEAAQSHEVKNSAQYVSELEAKINKITQQLKGAKGEINGVILAPDATDPRIHDELGVQRGGIIITRGVVDVNKNHKYKYPDEVGGKTLLALSSEGKGPVDTIVLGVKEGSPEVDYGVSSNPAFSSSLRVSYDKKPQVVEGQMDDFFQEAEHIIATHYKNPQAVLTKIAKGGNP